MKTLDKETDKRPVFLYPIRQYIIWNKETHLRAAGLLKRTPVCKVQGSFFVPRGCSRFDVQISRGSEEEEEVDGRDVLG